MRAAPPLVLILLLLSCHLRPSSSFTLAPAETDAPIVPTVSIECKNNISVPSSSFVCQNGTFFINTDVELNHTVRFLSPVVIASLSKITFAGADLRSSPLFRIEGQLQLDASLVLVIQQEDIVSPMPVITFASLRKRSPQLDDQQDDQDEEWITLTLLLPPCASARSIALETNETAIVARIKGISCARNDASTQLASFIGLGCGLFALVALAMALRVTQWTYVVYDTTETMRKGYERVRVYLPLPAGPQPLSDEYMREILREEHEDELE